jgi:hypothetical protein
MPVESSMLGRRDLAARVSELPAQLLVLVLQLVGAPETVEPVGDGVDHVVGQRLQR